MILLFNNTKITFKFSLRCFFIILFCLLLNSKAAFAQEVKINTLLTTEGLNKDGFPVTYKNNFSLSDDKGVQYYVEWIDDQNKHDILIKWFDSKDKLINYLLLKNFSKNIVRDYISFIKKNRSQFMIPNQLGAYYIYLYIDNKLVSITKFNIIK
ncbi:hypothetical protein [Orenia marismortui]|uniref:hypothetical protein n=1 Tax=Orenia marismortui TaxID=46469 RepID=UPI001FB924F3|nr:hypothetical protein [Orenia marismortui]